MVGTDFRVQVSASIVGGGDRLIEHGNCPGKRVLRRIRQLLSRGRARHAAETDSVLRDKGLKTFFDRRNLAAGLPWVRALEQAIGAAKAVIVLIGPRGLGKTHSNMIE